MSACAEKLDRPEQPQPTPQRRLSDKLQVVIQQSARQCLGEIERRLKLIYEGTIEEEVPDQDRRADRRC